MGKSDPYIALGPLGVSDYRKLRVDADDALIISGVVTGNFNVTTSGLAAGLKVKSVTITDVPTLIKTDLVTRDTMSARIIGTETVYIGPIDVTVAEGYPKFFREEIIADVQSVAATEIYGICEPGKTCEVRVLEIDA